MKLYYWFSTSCRALDRGGGIVLCFFKIKKIPQKTFVVRFYQLALEVVDRCEEKTAVVERCP